MALKQEKIHDRTSSDLPINSVVSIAIVQDPYSDKGEQIQVLRSVRDDPLAWMKSRRQIDDAQYEAGRKWQRLHGESTIGNIRAIDPGKEAVDGGIMPDAITDRQIAAFQELAECAGELGFFGNRLVFAVLGEGRKIVEVASQFELVTELEIKYLGRRFRECLEVMAMHWGYASRKYHET